MPRAKTLLITVPTAFAILVLCAWKNPAAWMRYHGDGKLSDSGFFSHPRYQITFADVALDRPNEERFRIAGLPVAPMQLLFVPHGNQVASWSAQPSRELNDITVTSTIQDEHDNVVCRESGHPATSTEKVWNVVSKNDPSNSQLGCALTDLHGGGPYTLSVRVVEAGANYRDTTMSPILRGGGLDTP